MDEYELEPCLGIAKSSLGNQNFSSIGSEISIKFESNIITRRSTLLRELGKQAKNHHGSITVFSKSLRLPQLKLPKIAGAF